MDKKVTDPNVITSGHLDVGDGHKIYYEEWGNKKAFPIMHLHGGPGGSFDESSKQYYNPKKHHVIFHDQRGCGKSLPYASTKNNTSQDLIDDIVKLRNHLGIKQVAVIGGSWGSTLTLLYAIAHPESVTQMIIWGVYLIRQVETDYVNEGFMKYTFPEAWERFIEPIPKKDRKNGDLVMQFYADKIRSKDPKEALHFANEWTIWECTLMSLDYDPQAIEKEVKEDNTTLSTAVLETHYFLNKCFVPDNYILSNVDKIKHIPIEIIQGRFDFCTPPIGARDLALAYGKMANLTWVKAGHYSGSEIELQDAIVQKVNAIL